MSNHNHQTKKEKIKSMETHSINPAEKSRKYIQHKIRKKGYKVTPTIKTGTSSQYWIIYTADEKNKERCFKDGSWQLI